MDKEPGATSESITEDQTVRYLLEHGFKTMETFTAGQPLLCVIPQRVKKTGKDAPCLARFNNPRFFNSFLLGNSGTEDKGEQVDFYTIDSLGIPKFLYSSYPSKSFAVEKNRIFLVGESDLFPKAVTASPATNP